MCSRHRHLFLLLCWLAVLSNYSCQAVTTFQMASYLVTQKAFDDAPDRYSDFINIAIQDAENAKLPDDRQTEKCGEDYTIYGSQAKTVITLVPHTLKLTIVDDHTIQSTATADVEITVPVYLKACKRIVFCFCHTVCADKTSETINSQLTITILWAASLDGSTGVITITPTPTITFGPMTYRGGCQLGGITGWFFNVKALITAAIQAAVTTYANQYAQAFSNPPTFSPYAGIVVAYKFTSLLMSPNTYVQLTAQGTISVQIGSNLVPYDDPSIDDANMAPPTTWSMSAAGGQLILLNDLRVSSTALSALAWAGGVTGAFVVNSTTKILDAEINLKLGMTQPLTGVTGVNQVFLNVAAGYSNGTCASAGEGMNKVMLEFTFANLTGTAHVNYTGNEDTVSLTMQVDSFNTEYVNVSLLAPPLPVPLSILNNVLKDLLNNSIPAFNVWLRNNPFVLPPNIAKYIPNPSVTVYNQSGCCDNMHGYIDMTSYCKCEPASSSYLLSKRQLGDWLPCQFPCSTYSTMLEKPIPVSGPAKNLTATTLPNSSMAAGLLRREPDEHDERRSLDATLSDVAPMVIFVSLYQSPAGQSNSACSLDQTGQSVTVTQLADTGGQCLQSSDGTYNLIKLGANGLVVHAELSCSNNTCGNLCTIIVNNVFFDQCGVVQQFSILFSSTYCAGPAWTTPALGPAVIELNFANSVSCALPSGAAPNVVVTALNIGRPNGKCIAADPSDPNSYSVIAQNPAIPTRYIMNLACSMGCDPQSCQNTLFNVTFNSCQVNAASTTDSLLIISGSQVLGCGIAPPQQNTFSLAERIGTISAVSVLFVGVLLYLRERKEQKRLGSQYVFCGFVRSLDYKAFGLFLKHLVVGFAEVVWALLCFVGRSTRDLSIMFWEWCNVVFVWPWNNNQLDREQYVESFLTLLASVGFFAQALLWILNSPFAYFDATMLQDLGLPVGAIDTHMLHYRFSSWSLSGQVVCTLVALGLLMVVIMRFFAVRPTPRTWGNVRIIMLALALMSQVFLIFMPSFFFVYNTSISIIPSNSSIVSNDPQIRENTDVFIGYSFAGVVFSYISNLVLYLLHPFVPGVFLASSIYFTAMETQKKWCSQLARETFFARIRILNIIVLLTGPVAAALPVIILYQSFGVDKMWIGSWGLMWVLPFLFFIHLRSQMEKEEPSLKQLIGNVVIFFVLFFGLTAYTLAAEDNFQQLTIAFPSGLIVSGFIGTFALCFLLLKRAQDNMDLEAKRILAGALSVVEAMGLAIAKNDEVWRPPWMVSCLHSLDRFLVRPFKLVIRRLWLDRLWYWLAEKYERENPQRFGQRLPYRRFFHMVGLALDGYIVFSAVDQYTHESVKEQVLNFLNSLDLNFAWPDAQNGGTVFDDAFYAYQVARWYQFGFLAGGFILLLISFVADASVRNRRGLWWSRFFGFASLLVMFVGVMATALPNYLLATHIDLICPKCAPEFNNAVNLLSGDIVGIFCAGLFTLSLLPILLAVSPALVRASKLILTDRFMRRQMLVAEGFGSTTKRAVVGDEQTGLNHGDLDGEDEGDDDDVVAVDPSETQRLLDGRMDTVDSMRGFGSKANDVAGYLRAENVRLVFSFSTLVTPITTGLPIMVFYQLFGDTITAVLILAFWLIPILIGLVTQIGNINRNYNWWLFFYFMPLLGILIYEVQKHGLSKPLEDLLKSPDIYCEIGAEICIANVILSDVLYSML